MAYLIDSDLSIDHLNNDPEAIALLARLAPERIFISVISYMEIYEGWLRNPGNVSARKLEEFVSSVPIIMVSEETARQCAYIRMSLSQRGRRVRQRALDLVIAATAIENNLTLVTRNVHDYRDIPELILFERSS